MDGTADYFDAWPKPFPSREAAIAHFGGPALQSEMWADGLEELDGGLWPRWDAEVMSRTIRAAFSCVSTGSSGRRSAARPWRSAPWSARTSTGRWASASPTPHLVALDHNEHDLHLHHPETWRRALEDFLATVT